MEEIDISRFRRLNNLLQQTVADYIGVTRSYLSQVENGRAELAPSKIQRLINNDKGWDVSTLCKQNETIVQSMGNGCHNNTQVIGVDVSVLEEKISMLEKLLEEKERTIQILLNK